MQIQSLPKLSIQRLNTNELATILKTEHPTNLQWTYADEPKEQHHTIFRATKEKAIVWTLGKK